MTTGAYAADHADALATIRDAGAPVSFALTSTPRDPTTNVAGPPVTTTVAGFAIGKKPNAIRYQALGLVESQAATLLFVPSTYGQVPPMSAAVLWNGVGFVVRDVDPVVAIDGKLMIASVIVSR
jgi:hypothetical protein